MTLTVQNPVYRGETCRACQTPIVFVPTEKGRREPLEQEPKLASDPAVPETARRIVGSLDGEPPLSRGLKRAAELGWEAQDGSIVWVAHFATCPSRDRFRR